MDFEEARIKAIKYLGISKKTESEVREKLVLSNCNAEIAEQVIEYLKELNYINDNDYVDAYIRQNMRLFKFSIFEIKQKLLQKGIKKYIIEEKIEVLHENDYESKVVEKLKESKLKNMDELKKKQYLYKRGFRVDIDNY